MEHRNSFPASRTRTNHRDLPQSIQAGCGGERLNPSLATAPGTWISAKAEAENRRADADLVEMVASRIARDPSPEEPAKASAEYERETTGASAEYDRVTTETWAEYLNITNKSAYLFERAMSPDMLPAYLQRIAGSFVEYRRVIARAEADLQRILAEADAQQTRF